MQGKVTSSTVLFRTEAIRRVQEERHHQLELGFTSSHDDSVNRSDELARAALCYWCAFNERECSSDVWPWDQCWWKPQDRANNLVRSAALYMAAVDQERRRMLSDMTRTSTRLYHLREVFNNVVMELARRLEEETSNDSNKQ